MQVEIICKMCKVYNQIGSLAYVLSTLSRKNIDDFKSINDILDFQKNYSHFQRVILEKHELLIKEEELKLKEEIPSLEKYINEVREQTKFKLNQEIETLENTLLHILKDKPSNLFKKIYFKLKAYYYDKRINHLKLQFDQKINETVELYEGVYKDKRNRYEFIKSNLNEAIKNSCAKELKNLERKKNALEEINSYISGAVGEDLVVKEISKLSDDYTLINDFSLHFNKPIYNSAENDYIKSIQIDHILISPAGIFLIETKNWSEKSLNNNDLRSPVQQIKRTSYALYNLIHRDNSRRRPRLEKHHWGTKKIPIRCLVVMTNAVPSGEFEFVKILPLRQLNNYLEYFKPIFSDTETKEITDYLISYL